jgi:hypothetical protein
MSQFSIEKSQYYVHATPQSAEEKEKNFSREEDTPKKNSKKELLQAKVKEWLEETTFFMSLGDLMKKEKDPLQLKELFALHKKMVQMLLKKNKVQVALEILGTQEKREVWFESLLEGMNQKEQKDNKKSHKFKNQAVNISKKMFEKVLESNNKKD